jgi:hypothetical protein
MSSSKMAPLDASAVRWSAWTAVSTTQPYRGVPCRKIGRLVRFAPVDVARWIDTHGSNRRAFVDGTVAHAAMRFLPSRSERPKPPHS